MSVSVPPVFAPRPPGRVLPTLNEDGSRRWIRPKWAKGDWGARRRVLAWALMLVWLALPHVRVNDRPFVLLDFPTRHFTIFGATFLPTDTILLMLLLVSGLIGIFLLTALFGRAWCGWACPQTVWLEFLFRPIERLWEGGERGSLRMDAEPDRWHWRRWAKHATYAVIAVFLGNTFLAYFVGTDKVVQWMQLSPLDHPTPFVIMALFSGGVFFDFAYFREQFCLVACPYGRWQSALLDRQSMIVAYDARRGEPRGKGKARDGLGSCVDCGQCVAVCPTGIDIRNGLQMECVHCTQCMDACDAVMDKVGQPRGLVRYATRDGLDGKPRRVLRARTIIYPAAFSLFFGGFLYALGTKATADVTFLGAAGAAPYTVEPSGNVVNPVRVKVVNRGATARRFRVTITDGPEATLVAPTLPLAVEAGKSGLAGLFVVLPPSAFTNGVRAVTFRVDDGEGFTDEVTYRLAGPRRVTAAPTRDTP